MFSATIQAPAKPADTNLSGVSEAMEDALLLHVCECPQCLTAALGRQERLKESGCDTFRRLAERVSASVALQDSIAFAAGHLTEDAIEEYCFGRLPAEQQSQADAHIAACSACSKTLASHREFISCLKAAFSSASFSLSSGFERLTVIPPATPAPMFSAESIVAAREHLPISRFSGFEALRLMDRENVRLSEIENVLKGDPVIGAHLIRVSNSALFSYGHETRTVEQAIARIGLQRTRLHVWGLAAKRMFLTPHSQRIWNHSVLAAQVSRQLAEMTRVIPADEACLAALVHDIGQIVFAGLGQSYERAYAQKYTRGLKNNQIERELCGITHAEAGADLLAAWTFPNDLVNAVRYHHNPLSSSSPFAPLLYVAETWLAEQEDVCDLSVHTSCLRKLGLTRNDLAALGVKHSPDLEMLRFAA